MAILSGLPGATAEVVVDGQALKEYPDEDDPGNSPKTTSVYVESVPGTEFSLRCTFGRNFPFRCNDLLYETVIDGDASEAAHRKKELFDNRGESVVEAARLRGVENGRCITKSFTFQTLSIDENLSPSRDPKLIKQIAEVGTLEIRLRRVKAKVDTASAPLSSSNHVLDTIPEKALKGRSLSHRAGYGASQPASRKPRNVVKKYIDKEPYATFKFKYMTKEKLQNLLIMPRTPSPEPLENRNVDSMTEEEVRRALREVRSSGLRSGGTRIKQEMKRDAEAGNFERPVKREKHSNEPTQTVDLTIDDMRPSEPIQNVDLTGDE